MAKADPDLVNGSHGSLEWSSIHWVLYGLRSTTSKARIYDLIEACQYLVLSLKARIDLPDVLGDSPWHHIVKMTYQREIVDVFLTQGIAVNTNKKQRNPVFQFLIDAKDTASLIDCHFFK